MLSTRPSEPHDLESCRLQPREILGVEREDAVSPRIVGALEDMSVVGGSPCGTGLREKREVVPDDVPLKGDELSLFLSRNGPFSEAVHVN